VVGFIVQPSSKAVTLDAEGNANCETENPLILSQSSDTQIIYTYNVEWRVHPPNPPLPPFPSFPQFTLGVLGNPLGHPLG
jgi:hypothetical protein